MKITSSNQKHVYMYIYDFNILGSEDMNILIIVRDRKKMIETKQYN